MIRAGQRVGAILSEDGEAIEFLGFGIYLGKKVPVGAVGPIAEALREFNEPDSCILLDSGQTVYGCECWWNTENKIQSRLQNKPVINIDIDRLRKTFRPIGQA